MAGGAQVASVVNQIVDTAADNFTSGFSALSQSYAVENQRIAQEQTARLNRDQFDLGKTVTKLDLLEQQNVKNDRRKFMLAMSRG